MVFAFGFGHYGVSIRSCGKLGAFFGAEFSIAHKFELLYSSTSKRDSIVRITQTENLQAARQARFTSVREIVKMKPILKAYINEAIEVEKAGLKVPFKKTKEFDIPEEFQNKLNKNPALKKAFNALTPGRQRAYILYFSAPKRSKTREARVEKSMQQILNGKGLDDQ